jgi:uncharacterized protein involved in tolerance to divalent cations
MINVIIYLDKINEAKNLVDMLLTEELIANASIDSDNVSYRIEDNQIVTSVNYVITAQTKSLLFSMIDRFISERYGHHVPIYATPIIQANESFDTLIRSNTRKI